MKNIKSSNGTAFTLIELIGVMAIIGILSAVLLPPLISKIEDANSVGEDAKLEEIARALVAGIKATGMIPNPNLAPFAVGGWGDIARLQTTLTDDSAGPGTLHYVFPMEDQATQEASARRVYVDNVLLNYLGSQFGAVNVPFQTPATGWLETAAGGVVFPNQAMNMYIVSSSKKGLELYCGENQATTPPQPAPGYGAGLILDLRNWVKIAQPSGSAFPGSFLVPPSIARWLPQAGQNYQRGEFLHVKTVDLRPLFCRVELIDTACPPTATINTAGAGYQNGDVVSFNVGPVGGSYPFAFTYNNIWGAGVLTGNPPLMLTKPFNPNPPTTADPGLGNAGRTGNSAGAGAIATLASTAAPQFQINQMAAQAFGANNTEVFYVLKGTSLSLLNNAGATLITLTVQGDSIFKYFNSTWSRVD